MTTSYARSFKDLRVYAKAREVSRAVFALSKALNSGLEEIGRMLNSMIEKSDSFCGPLDSALHESSVEYFTSTLEPRTDD